MDPFDQSHQRAQQMLDAAHGQRVRDDQMIEQSRKASDKAIKRAALLADQEREREAAKQKAGEKPVALPKKTYREMMREVEALGQPSRPKRCRR